MPTVYAGLRGSLIRANWVRIHARLKRKVSVIVGSTNTVSAISPQAKGNKTYAFSSWSDGGDQAHTIVAPAAPTTYTARYK